MQLFYAPDISDFTYVFDEEESRHIIKVLRLKKGDQIYITDGRGNLFKTRIETTDPKHCKVSVEEKTEEYNKKQYFLHIAIAPTKNIKRFEWFLEKCTEIGINEITPLICEHSERSKLRHERLNKVLTAAMKQSIKTYLPKLNEAREFEAFIKENQSDLKAIAICDKKKKDHLKNFCEQNNEISVIIGPEGDFSENEIEIALNAGYKPVSLGKSRLRTETAGVMACSIVNTMKE
jgi:16S rRNA (uracil1498-N3)-methyltransferase